MSRHFETIRIGFMPLLDAAIPVIAARGGFGARHGLNIELVRETSWANVRDRLAIGHFDAAHLLAPLPIAAALGLTPFEVPLIAPMTLGHGGNAITVSASVWAMMQAALPDLAVNDPVSTGDALRRVVSARQANGEAPLVFAVVHAISSHNYELRHWLHASGIDPDKDVAIAIVPPPYMPDALAAGRINGFCVGEPWNSCAAAAGSGAIILTKAALWPHSPDKVLAMRADWAEKHPALVNKLLLAMVEAAEFCADPANLSELITIMGEPDILDVPPEAIRPALTGQMSLADAEQLVAGMIEFARHGANIPRLADAQWYLDQMIRWKQVDSPATPDLATVFRPDLYYRAAQELGIRSPDQGSDGAR